MKNTLLTILCLSLIGFAGIVSATSPSLDISPINVTKTPGDVFQISLGVNSSGEKVCAVEGTLSFKNLSCQNITVASGVMAQSSPTCSNPYFLIGIPSCTTGDKPLLSVSVRTGSAGTASLSITGVDLIGEGTSLSNASVIGNYTIATPVVPVVPVIPKTIIEPEETSGSTEEIPEEIVISSEDQESLKEETSSNPVVQDTSSESSAVQANLLSVVSNILSFGTGNGWLLAVSILVLLAILVFVINYFIKNRKKKIQ